MTPGRHLEQSSQLIKHAAQIGRRRALGHVRPEKIVDRRRRHVAASLGEQKLEQRARLACPSTVAEQYLTIVFDTEVSQRVDLQATHVRPFAGGRLNSPAPETCTLNDVRYFDGSRHKIIGAGIERCPHRGFVTVGGQHNYRGRAKCVTGLQGVQQLVPPDLRQQIENKYPVMSLPE